MKQDEIYEKITETIITWLETSKDDISWQKQWKYFAGNNHKSILNRPYQGVNQLLCGLTAHKNNWESKTWATFNQWNKMGHKIKKGSSGTNVIKLLKLAVKEKDNSGKEITKGTFSSMKFFTVFNGNQVENYSGDKQLVEPKLLWSPEDFAMIDNRAKELGVVLKDGENKCYFSPSEDCIGMPQKFQFKKPEHYYASFLHELTHWTDKENRSPREEKIKKIFGGGSRFSEENYAFEELVAEIGSAFLLSHYNLETDSQMREDHIPYIKFWIKSLKSNNKMIVKAASYAQSACNFITGQSYLTTEEKLKEGENNV